MTKMHRNRTLAMLLSGFAIIAVAADSAWAEGAYASHGLANASPGEVYLRYVEVLAKADSVEDIFPFSPFSDARNRQDLATLPIEQRKQALTAMKGMAMLNAQVLSEKVEGDTATVEVRGRSPGLMSGQLEPTWGTITLVRREGEWKVTNQALRAQPQSDGEP